MGKSKGTHHGAQEDLLELSNIQLAAICLHEAMNSYYFKDLPTDARAWNAYQAYHGVLKWSERAVFGLILLTIFEVPIWCRGGAQEGVWVWRDVKDICVTKDGSGPPLDQLQMSNLPTLPIGVSLTLEYFLLGIVLYKVSAMAKLHGYFREIGVYYRGPSRMILDYSMLLFGFCDVFYYSFWPTASCRIAPFVRFGLAISVPWIREGLSSFVRATRAILTIGLFLLGTIVIFAWLGAMIFDDLDQKGKYGMPINQGFESFGASIYTMFASMTTAVLPDSMVPSYAENKAIAFFWMPFFILGCCIFQQVILATVYAEYQDQATDLTKHRRDMRKNGIDAAFKYLKVHALHAGEMMDVVFYDAFKEVVMTLRLLEEHLAHERVMHTYWEALDDDKSDALTLEEFRDFCEVLQTKIFTVERDSPVKKRLEGTRLGEIFTSIMTNGEEGPDMGCVPPAWIPSKFSGCIFDRLINVILALNVLWLIVESVYDLNDIPELPFFGAIDTAFSLIYLLEVGVKLCWWTWDEYWLSNDNRFDFITSIILASASIATMVDSSLNSEVVRYVNFLRLVRVLKALNNIEEYRKTWEIIACMITTCQDVLAMNLLVIYVWSASGLQLFGGQLYEGNPVLADHIKDLDYFGSHFQVYNFNDMGAAMITMFFVVLTDWVDQISLVCIALHEHYTFGWFLASGFWLSFYVGAPLIAWNVWTAFSIDVFVMLRQMRDENDKTEVESNLEAVQADMAAEGWCLHIFLSSELKKDKIYRKMFDEDGDEDDDDKSSKSGSSQGSSKGDK